MTSVAHKGARTRLPARQIAAVVVGNWLEFYDFLTYSFFAIQIGHTFFPDYSPGGRLLLSLATFGAGFFTRPLGGFIIGRYADRKGRKPALIISFVLMGIGLLGLALTPSYRAIGLAAPLLALACRMLQGFALGGQVGPATAYLIEAAPPERRGWYASFSYAAQDAAALTAGLVGVALSALLTPDALNDYGWRIAFLLGGAIIPFGIVMRTRLAETLEPDEGPKAAAPPLRPYLPVALFGLVMLAAGTVTNYVLDYMTTYANNTLHMNTTVAFGATVVIGVFLVASDLASGLLSDRYGRKPVMLIPYALMLVLAVPAYILILHFHNMAALFGASAVLAVLQGIGGSPVVTWITESLPPRIRAGGVSVIYAVSIAAFGGTAQFMVEWLKQLTGNPLTPGWYMTVALAAGVAAMCFVRETAPRIIRGNRGKR